MNQNLTEIVVVLDESSSMGSVREATIEGFNAFVDAQRVQPGECRLTLQKFNTSVPEPTFVSQDIRTVPVLGGFNYWPNGMTALYDAIGTQIDALGKRLALTPEHQRPGKVIFVIQTDGQENISQRYNLAKINSMIEHQKSVYSWDFMFIGSAKDLDVAAVALSLGINDKSTISYAKGVTGTTNVFAAAANYVNTARAYGSASACFTVADKTAALEEDLNTVTGTTSAANTP
jgi:hypothetical protein